MKDYLYLSDIQQDLGLTIYQAKTLASDPTFNFPIWSLSKTTRRRKWCSRVYAQWKLTHWEKAAPRFTLMGGIIKQKENETSENVQILINWVKRSAHIERHTLRLQQEAASKRLCASYGVKSLLEIKL